MRRPPRRREPLGIALRPGGAGRLRPRAVDELHPDEGRATGTEGEGNARVVAERDQRDQRERRVERLGRGLRERSPAPRARSGRDQVGRRPTGGLRSVGGPASRRLDQQHGRRLDHVADRAGPDPLLRLPQRRGMARVPVIAEDAGGERRGEPTAVGRGRPDDPDIPDRPRAVDAPVGREPNGRPPEGRAEVVPAGFDRRGQCQRELEAGQALVVGRAIPAVGVPAFGTAEPGGRIPQRRAIDGHPGHSGVIEGPGGVAVIVTGEAAVLPRPSRDLGREVRDGPAARLVDPRGRETPGDQHPPDPGRHPAHRPPPPRFYPQPSGQGWSEPAKLDGGGRPIRRGEGEEGRRPRRPRDRPA